GGTVTFTLTSSNGTGYCPSTRSEESSFTVAPSSPVVAHCPEPVSLPACTPAADIASAYSAWAGSFNTTGGCSPVDNHTSVAPYSDMCAGGTVTFTLTSSNGTGYCPST